jgi:hypothetical protein
MIARLIHFIRSFFAEDPALAAARAADRKAWHDRWLTRATALHAANAIDRLDAEIAAETATAALPSWEVDDRRVVLDEQLAHQFAAAGDRAAAGAFARRVIKYHDEERLRESGGAGGHPAYMALVRAQERLKHLLDPS